jgi:hypothetical protein
LPQKKKPSASKNLFALAEGLDTLADKPDFLFRKIVLTILSDREWAIYSPSKKLSFIDYENFTLLSRFVRQKLSRLFT